MSKPCRVGQRIPFLLLVHGTGDVIGESHPLFLRKGQHSDLGCDLTCLWKLRLVLMACFLLWITFLLRDLLSPTPWFLLSFLAIVFLCMENSDDTDKLSKIHADDSKKDLILTLKFQLASSLNL